MTLDPDLSRSWAIRGLGAAGRGTNEFLAYVGRLSLLLGEVLYWVTLGPWRGRGKVRYRATMDQMVLAGVYSLPIACLIQFLVGVIIALLLAYYLKALAPGTFIPSIVSVASARELGPLILAIVLAARVGASITAELGTMVVSEEVTALETMAVNPVNYLVAPRFIALVLLAPFMTLVVDVVGMLGGYLVTALLLDMSLAGYTEKALEYLRVADVITGVVKGTAFAAVIVLVGCQEGLSVENGAEGVGRNTMRSVVNAIVLIILTDLLFTVYFFVTG